MILRRAWKRFAADERGDSLVEFGISISVLLMSVFGVIDCARAIYTYHFVSYAAQEGARYAMVRGEDWSSSCASATSYGCIASASNVSTYVQSLTPLGITASKVTVTTTWPQTTATGSSTGCNTAATQNAKGCLVKVNVSYSFKFMLPYLPTGSLAMASTSDEVIAY